MKQKPAETLRTFIKYQNRYTKNIQEDINELKHLGNYRILISIKKFHFFVKLRYFENNYEKTLMYSKK